MKTAHSLQFCDNCSSLALAVMDSAPLCLSCMVEELKKSDDKHLIYKIQPLPIAGHCLGPSPELPEPLCSTANFARLR